MILETERLYLREMTEDDFPALCKILQDKDVMYAWEHAFSDKEVREWLNNQLVRYKEKGVGYWAAVLKETDEMIGQCGILKQDYHGREVCEIGYLLRKDCWHRGYATELALACKKYVFDVLNEDEVFSFIRDNNIDSQNVARRNGMTVRETVIKHYYNMDMPHIVFSERKGLK